MNKKLGCLLLMGILNLSAKNVLEESGLHEYEAGMGFFYSELVELNTILYLAEQIVQFPFDLFTHRDDIIFFTIVMGSFHDSAILIITRLATDQAGDLFTLPRFKNRVRDWVKSKFKDAFDVRLREARFEAGVKSLFEKARELRRHRIAHTTQEFISGGVKLSRPNISELKELRDALNSLLDALSFNVEHMMLPIPYDPRVIHPVESNHKTDIEKILDRIAKDSHILNMPEKNPERWRYRRSNLSEDKLKILNQYRRKFNLPEA
ncbi:MAG: hypothetical protein M3407_03230 [Acidobacteriota bacterium]|nr:hypothetical protein [Acidobacteriota bacterium]